MSKQIQSNIIIGIFTLAGTFGGIFITHFLECKRRKEELLFQEKKKTYAEILVGMSSSFLPEGKDLKEILGDSFFETKVRLKVGNLLSQGRLLANSLLSNKFREFYDCEMNIWDSVSKDINTDELSKKRASLVRDIEVLMRKELKIAD